MNVALQRPLSIGQFLEWAGAQDGRYEFDGVRPVAMTGGNARHSRITMNIHAALRSRLRGSPCSVYGPDLGVQTIGSRVRYPDALITCAAFPDTDQLAPDVRIVFEVLSPSSGPTDRVDKVREYAAVASMRRYVIVETLSAALVVLHRDDGVAAWTTLALAGGDALALPEIGLVLPVAEIYDSVAFAGA